MDRNWCCSRPQSRVQTARSMAGCQQWVAATWTPGTPAWWGSQGKRLWLDLELWLSTWPAIRITWAALTPTPPPPPVPPSATWTNQIRSPGGGAQVPAFPGSSGDSSNFPLPGLKPALVLGSLASPLHSHHHQPGSGPHFSPLNHLCPPYSLTDLRK